MIVTVAPSRASTGRPRHFVTVELNHSLNLTWKLISKNGGCVPLCSEQRVGGRRGCSDHDALAGPDRPLWPLAPGPEPQGRLPPMRRTTDATPGLAWAGRTSAGKHRGRTCRVLTSIWDSLVPAPWRGRPPGNGEFGSET